MMITGVVETFALCLIIRLFTTSAFRVQKFLFNKKHFHVRRSKVWRQARRKDRHHRIEFIKRRTTGNAGKVRKSGVIPTFQIMKQCISLSLSFSCMVYKRQNAWTADPARTFSRNCQQSFDSQWVYQKLVFLGSQKAPRSAAGPPPQFLPLHFHMQYLSDFIFARLKTMHTTGWTCTGFFQTNDARLR